MPVRATTIGAAAALAALVFWLLQSEALEASGLQRRLSDARFDRTPFGMEFPEPWQAELRAAIARAPEVSLDDPAAPGIAAEVLRGVSWIHPDSVRAELSLPDGIAVDYYPRQARYQLLQSGRPAGVLSADGCLLPPGLPGEVRAQLIQLELAPVDELPAPGRPLASPIAQEALRCFFEIVAIEEAAALQVVRIRPIRDRPSAVRNEAPGLRFVLADGRELDWGRSDLSRAPDEPDSEKKAARLGSVMRQYPRLAGVQAVVLDRPQEVLVLDEAYRQLPFDGIVLRPR